MNKGLRFAGSLKTFRVLNLLFVDQMMENLRRAICVDADGSHNSVDQVVIQHFGVFA